MVKLSWNPFLRKLLQSAIWKMAIISASLDQLVILLAKLLNFGVKIDFMMTRATSLTIYEGQIGLEED